MDYPGKVITKNQVTPTQTSATGVWTLDDAAAAVRNNNWPVAGVPNPISRSLRFNSADSAYLNRTPGVAGNRRTWTWSGWVKRSFIGATNTNGTGLFGAGTLGNNANFRALFDSGAIYLQETVQNVSNQLIWTSTPVYRDPSAWYHIVIAMDTTQATAANRVKVYVNGSQITGSFSVTPSQNQDTSVNNNVAQYQGASPYNSAALWYLDGYLTEINFIDGQALTPSSFGMTDPQTGAWEPIKYTGTYGTNGFYLNFKDATSTTTLGYDYSGNANNWTTNNFSVTAGAGNDSLTDVPTPWIAYNTTGDVGGVVRGNYCVMSPLELGASTTLTNGNLTATTTAVANRSSRGTIFVSNGKWYFEALLSSIGASSTASIGIIQNTDAVNGTIYPGSTSGGYGYVEGGNKVTNNSGSAYGSSYTTNDLISVALDLDNGRVWFAKNGTWQASGNPSAGTNAAFTGLSGSFAFAVGMLNGTTWDVNFGQRPFAYTPPAGFLSLCTTNLPTPTIGATSTTQAGKYMNVVLYTGDGNNGRSITGVGFQTDFNWTKSRSSGSYSHQLSDAVRGFDKYLYSNATNAEGTDATNHIQSVNSDGYVINSGASFNANTVTYVAWNWKANGAGSSNTAGSITSTVSANTTAGFSIVTYTGTGANATVGHGLGVAPSMIIVKDRDQVNSWGVYHDAIGNTKILFLESTSASQTVSTAWNNTSPTSTVFTIGATGTTNQNTKNFVAYCFAAVAGYSAFGSYTGNGSSDGPFIYLGFRPRWILIKNSSASASWYIYDAVRNTFNVVDKLLYPNLSNAEDTYTFGDILSNGFKIRSTDSGMNGNGNTIIYAAFAEFPFKFSLAR